MALILNCDYLDLLSILIKFHLPFVGHGASEVMAAAQLNQRLSNGICLPKQPCAYKHSCIKIMKSRTIYLFFPTHYCYMISMETKQGSFNMTPGGAAVFLNTTQGLNNSIYIKYLWVLTRCRVNCLLMKPVPLDRMNSSK